jgi:hypothetical protein
VTVRPGAHQDVPAARAVGSSWRRAGDRAPSHSWVTTKRGKNITIVQSLVASCKLHEVNPYDVDGSRLPLEHKEDHHADRAERAQRHADEPALTPPLDGSHTP